MDAEGPPSTAESSSSAAISGGGPSRYSKALIVTPEGCSLDPVVLPMSLKTGGLGQRHVFSPSSDGINTNLLILLHGLGVRPDHE